MRITTVSGLSGELVRYQRVSEIDEFNTVTRRIFWPSARQASPPMTHCASPTPCSLDACPCGDEVRALVSAGWTGEGEED